MPQKDLAQKPSRVSQSIRGRLLFFSNTYENDSTSSLADCFSGAQRDLDSVRHRGQGIARRRNQVVRRCRSRWRLAEARRLLAHGVGG